MKTEYDYGCEYAQFLNATEIVDIETEIHKTCDIPPDDYTLMCRAGIENPNARLYWQGFNSFVRGNM